MSYREASFSGAMAASPCCTPSSTMKPAKLRQVRPEAPVLAGQIVSRTLEKSPEERYQSAAEVIRDTQDLLASLTTAVPILPVAERRRWGALILASVAALLIATGVGYWIYHRSAKKEWAHEEATPQIENLLAAKKPLAAQLLLDEARKYLPEDAQLKMMDEQGSSAVTVNSTPSMPMSRYRITRPLTGHGIVWALPLWQTFEFRKDIFAGRYQERASMI